MITLVQKGDFRKTNSFLEKLLEIAHLGELDKYGKMGVDALSAATPVLTGRAASSWYYKIERRTGSTSIIWGNNDIEGGCNVVLLLQHGHGTRLGGYVQGRDFINPAIKPVFDEIADSVWKEVSGR